LRGLEAWVEGLEAWRLGGLEAWRAGSLKKEKFSGGVRQPGGLMSNVSSKPAGP